LAKKSKNPNESAPHTEGADRSNCPPDERVRAYANGEITDDASLVEHIKQCAWCAEEFKDHARDLEWNRFINRSIKVASVVLLAILIVSALRSCH
jgi:hypothetical protein